jgi:hypothetical protein
MLKNTFVILITFLCLYTHAQSGEVSNPIKYKNTFKDVVFSPGIIVQHETFLDFNLAFGEVTVINGKIPLIGFDGFRVGVETN